MFEVVITKIDDTKETWDCLTPHQAECVFFKARMMPDSQRVELNELVDIDDFIV